MSNEVLTSSEPATAVATSTGIIAQEQQSAAAAIEAALSDLGFSTRVRDLRPVPFAGTWGVASSVCHALASEVAMRDLERTGTLDGLSKKEAKQRAADNARGKAQELAEQVAARVSTQPGIAKVEAVNGYINVYFDANAVAARLIGEVLSQAEQYGRGSHKSELVMVEHSQPKTLVMVEHSQPNTHKVFHIGHLRNTSLGIAVSRTLEAAGYPVMQANYIGDIGMHVIKCLWCYERFHKGQEPPTRLERGRWLGEDLRGVGCAAEYRKEVHRVPAHAGARRTRSSSRRSTGC